MNHKQTWVKIISAREIGGKDTMPGKCCTCPSVGGGEVAEWRSPSPTDCWERDSRCLSQLKSQLGLNCSSAGHLNISPTITAAHIWKQTVLSLQARGSNSKVCDSNNIFNCEFETPSWRGWSTLLPNQFYVKVLSSNHFQRCIIWVLVSISF